MEATLIDNRTSEIVTADDAWERHRRIVSLRNQSEATFLQLGEELYWFEDKKQFREMDYETFEAYLADPEVDISRSLAFQLKAIYRHFLLQIKVQTSGLLEAGHSKLQMLIPYTDAGNAQEWIEKAASLSCSDLALEMREAFPDYRGRVSDRDDYAGDNWHTPAQYIAAAREVMGEIDLDPATCDTAQAVVQAISTFTKEEDGLIHPWHGRVWLNPPYSMPSIAYFVAKAIDEYDAGNVTEAILLVNNSSDTKWFHRLLDRCPACFTAGRVQFWSLGKP